MRIWKLVALVGVVSVATAATFFGINFAQGQEPPVDLAQIVPDWIGDYEVMYIATPENTPCSTHSIINLRGPDPTPDDYIKGPGPAFIKSELTRLGVPADVEFSVGGPGTSKEQTVRILEEWVKLANDKGCMPHGKIQPRSEFDPLGSTPVATSSIMPLAPGREQEKSESPSVSQLPEIVPGFNVIRNHDAGGANFISCGVAAILMKECEPAKTMQGPIERFVQVRGIKLHYLDWGDNGPPLLMVHGDMRTSRSWDAVIRDLRSRFHIISLNTRGNGDSDWTDKGYRFEDRVADLAAFCESLDIRGTIGVGHSTGAVVLTLVAGRTPGVFNRLILLEPMIVVDEEFQRRVSRADKPVRDRRTWASREELYKYLRQHPEAGRWRDDVIRDVVDFETMELPDGSIDIKWASATMSWEEREGDYVDLRPTFRALGVPVLYIASEDRRSSYKDLDPLQAEVPDFQVVTVERTGHNMYMERPDAVSQAIMGFVDDQRLPACI